MNKLTGLYRVSLEKWNAIEDKSIYDNGVVFIDDGNNNKIYSHGKYFEAPGYKYDEVKDSFATGHLETETGEIIFNKAEGKNSFAEGKNTQALKDRAHAEGCNTIANARESHAEGWNTKTDNRIDENGIVRDGAGSHAEGIDTVATGRGAHAEGSSTRAIHSHTHAEGFHTAAVGKWSHAEGGMDSGNSYTILSATKGQNKIIYADYLNIFELDKYYIIGDICYYINEINDITPAESTLNYNIYEVIFDRPWQGMDIDYNNCPTIENNILEVSHFGITSTKPFWSPGKNNDIYYIDQNDNIINIYGNCIQNEDGTYTIENCDGIDSFSVYKPFIYKFIDDRQYTYTEGKDIINGNNITVSQWTKTNNNDPAEILTVYNKNSIYDLQYWNDNNQMHGQVEFYSDKECTQQLPYTEYLDDNERFFEYLRQIKSFDDNLNNHYINGIDLNENISKWELETDPLQIVYVKGSIKNVDLFKTLTELYSDETCTTLISDKTINSTSIITEKIKFSDPLIIQLKEIPEYVIMDYNLAIGESSHAEGSSTTASGYISHAEGQSTTASGDYSHAEGYNTTAEGESSHAEGQSTTASGYISHAEGQSTTASGSYSHAEGYNTRAIGVYASHAEGQDTESSGYGSHTEGLSTYAENQAQHTSGRYNTREINPEEYHWNQKDKTLFVVGNGDNYNERSDAFRVLRNGKVYIPGIGEYTGKSNDLTNKTDLANVIDDKINSTIFVTYDELRNLCAEGKLIKGQQYRITDYSTMIADNLIVPIDKNQKIPKLSVKSNNKMFDLIVTAKNANELYAEAKADYNFYNIWFDDGNKYRYTGKKYKLIDINDNEYEVYFWRNYDNIDNKWDGYFSTKPFNEITKDDRCFSRWIGYFPKTIITQINNTTLKFNYFFNPNEYALINISSTYNLTQEIFVSDGDICKYIDKKYKITDNYNNQYEVYFWRCYDYTDTEWAGYFSTKPFNEITENDACFSSWINGGITVIDDTTLKYYDILDLTSNSLSAFQYNLTQGFINSDLSKWKIWYDINNDSTKYNWVYNNTYMNIDGIDYQSRSIENIPKDIIYNGKKYYSIGGDDYYLTTLDTYALQKTSYNYACYFIDNNGNKINPYTSNIDDIQLVNINSISFDEGKGVIYRMIDEFNNECPYDFKNIYYIISKAYIGQHRYWYQNTYDTNNFISSDKKCYTFSLVDTFADWTTIDDYSLNLAAEDNKIYCHDNVIKQKFNPNNYTQELNCNIFLSNQGSQIRDNYLAEGCFGNVFSWEPIGNRLDHGCYHNNFGKHFHGNILRTYCNGNKFGNCFFGNIFNAYCNTNEFYVNRTANKDNQSEGNIFGTRCQQNKFYQILSNNTFGDGCNKNEFKGEISNNTFGDGFYQNKMSDTGSCKYSVFGKLCKSNNINSLIENCTFGFRCDKSIFNSNIINSTFGDWTRQIQIAGNCEKIDFGQSCYNIILKKSNSIRFGNHCNQISFGENFQNSSFGDNCNNIKLGDYFSNLSFKDNVYHIKFTYLDNSGIEQKQHHVSHVIIQNHAHHLNIIAPEPVQDTTTYKWDGIRNILVCSSMKGKKVMAPPDPAKPTDPPKYYTDYLDYTLNILNQDYLIKIGCDSNLSLPSIGVKFYTQPLHRYNNETQMEETIDDYGSLEVFKDSRYKYTYPFLNTFLNLTINADQDWIDNHKDVEVCLFRIKNNRWIKCDDMGAYFPDGTIDPDFPEDKKQFMILDIPLGKLKLANSEKNAGVNAKPNIFEYKYDVYHILRRYIKFNGYDTDTLNEALKFGSNCNAPCKSKGRIHNSKYMIWDNRNQIVINGRKNSSIVPQATNGFSARFLLRLKSGDIYGPATEIKLHFGNVYVNNELANSYSFAKRNYLICNGSSMNKFYKAYYQ